MGPSSDDPSMTTPPSHAATTPPYYDPSAVAQQHYGATSGHKTRHSGESFMTKKAAMAARAQVQAETTSQLVAKAAAKAGAKKVSTEEACVKAEAKAQIKLRSKPETKRAKAAKSRSFACDVVGCDKVYTSKNALARHMVAHTGVRGRLAATNMRPPTRATTHTSTYVSKTCTHPSTRECIFTQLGHTFHARDAIFHRTPK
jgi:hypothetical protein